METITFRCEVITPMFLAGADGWTPELRVPSIKGAMRFWWRACHGEKAIGDLQNDEMQIFGGVKGQKAIRSKVALKVNYDRIKLTELKVWNTMKFSDSTTDILNYMSYGTWGASKEKSRGFIGEGFEFKIQLRLSDELNHSQALEIKKAIELWISFGNLGMKMRNGFGTIQSPDCIETPESLFKSFKKGPAGILPMYHAFSQESKLFKTTKVDYTSWGEVIRTIGEFYKEHNEIKWGKVNPRHAKSYFISIKKDKPGYRGYLLFLPYDCQKIPSYSSETRQFVDKLKASPKFEEIP